MKIKIFTLSIIFFFYSSTLFSQKSHCRKLHIDAPIGDTIGMIDKSPYDQNTRANLVFYKRNINHLGCNENEYQAVVNDDFKNGFDTTIWQKEYPYSTPFNKVHSSLNDKYINTDNNVNIENGILKLHVAKDNPSYSYMDKNGISQTKNHPYSLGMIHSKNPLAGGEWKIEASGCYKFGKFSARIKFPKSDDINSALWFYGAGNEIDAYEIFHGTGGRIRSSIHQWNVTTDNNNTHAEYGLDANLGNLSEKFNIWEIEWTPYKITWSLNGKVFRVFYKYYKMTTRNLKHNKKSVCFIGLDCFEIPIGNNSIYELSGWNSFSTRPIDLILGMGITGTPKNNEVIEIDWMKIEQKPNLQLIADDDFPCLNQAFKVNAFHTDQIVSWEVSNNLDIIDIHENELTVVANQDSSIGWIEASVYGNNIDLPEGNWTTIGYTFNNEFSESALPFHNFSYNCTDAIMKVRKEIIVGKPILPILDNDIKPCFTYGGFEISIKNDVQYNPDSEFQWSSFSDASLVENYQSLWVIPDTSLENNYFEYELTISNKCGFSVYEEEIFVPDCENNSNLPTLVLYPNPVNNILFFGLQKTNYEVIEPSSSPFFIVQVGTGRIMGQGELGETSHQINVTNWGEGIYEIAYQINGEKKSTTFSVIH